MQLHNLSGKKGCDDAKQHSHPVVMNASHQPKGAAPCPYCKCVDSNKDWKLGIFKLRKDCSICSC
jgi:hypothetical protein